MTNAIPISWLNDYTFDPKSIYFHNVLADFDTQSYHQKPQIEGNLAHQGIEQKTYSNSKKYLISKLVFSQEFELIGKIDIFDKDQKILIERKNKINQIYQGHIYQLWAQYFCLLEEGFEIKKLKIYSISDNKNYWLEIPTAKQKEEFGELVKKVQTDYLFHGSENQNKNTNSIYQEYYF
jgi:CRISPR-associated exonuclease Cas4